MTCVTPSGTPKAFKYSCAATLCGAVLFLSACGGGSSGNASSVPTPAPTFSVSGSIAGLGDSSGLTLVNGSETLTVAANATSFSFANMVAQNGTYNVRIGNQPSDATCMIGNASGTVQQANVQSITVSCRPYLYTVSTLAGYGGPEFPGGYLDATGALARFHEPRDVALDGAGNLYVADVYNYTIRKIAPSGAVTSLAGGGVAGNVDATGANARFMNLLSVAADSAGNVYVVDGDAIRKVSPLGTVTTLLAVNSPQGIAVDSAGALYITSNNSVLKVTSNGVVAKLAGNDSAGFADGTSGAALFNHPLGVTVDSSGNVYVADSINQAIRKISPQGQVTTLASGSLVMPQGLTVDGVGNVYVTGDPPQLDQALRPFGGGSVRKLSRNGVVTLVAGGNPNGHTDGAGPNAQFYWPIGIAVDGAGNLYIADSLNSAIRKIVP